MIVYTQLPSPVLRSTISHLTRLPYTRGAPVLRKLVFFNFTHRRGRMRFFLFSTRVIMFANAGLYQRRLQLPMAARQSLSLNIFIIRHVGLFLFTYPSRLYLMWYLPRPLTQRLLHIAPSARVVGAPRTAHPFTHRRPGRLKRKVRRRIIIYGFYNYYFMSLTLALNERVQNIWTHASIDKFYLFTVYLGEERACPLARLQD